MSQDDLGQGREYAEAIRAGAASKGEWHDTREIRSIPFRFRQREIKALSLRPAFNEYRLKP
jgi:hypothetical protein